MFLSRLEGKRPEKIKEIARIYMPSNKERIVQLGYLAQGRWKTNKEKQMLRERSWRFFPKRSIKA